MKAKLFACGSFVSAMYLVSCGGGGVDPDNGGTNPQSTNDMGVAVGKFEPKIQSGQRLKIAYVKYTSADGFLSISPTNFYDAQLKTNCAMGLSPDDDLLRCLPLELRNDQEIPYNTGGFTDSACKQRAFAYAVVSTMPTGLYMSFAKSMNGSVRYTIGKARLAVQIFSFNSITGQCTPSPSGAYAFVVDTMADLLPADTFQRIEKTEGHE